MENNLVKTEKQMETGLQVFSSKENWELAQRIGTALSKSSLVPKEYQNNLPNTIIALEMADRIGASPLMVMQHLYIVHGKPSWSSSFLIAAINSCGRFAPLKFNISGSGQTLACYAYTTEKGDTEILKGPEITMSMAQAEGWLGKNGSKWKTMPELMIRYRAAAFWSRLYAPEITMGMQTAEEVRDVVDAEIITEETMKNSEILSESIKEKIKEQKEKNTPQKPSQVENKNTELFNDTNTQDNE